MVLEHVLNSSFWKAQDGRDLEPAHPSLALIAVRGTSQSASDLDSNLDFDLAGNVVYSQSFGPLHPEAEGLKLRLGE